MKLKLADIENEDELLRKILLKNLLEREFGFQFISNDIKKLIHLKTAQTGKKIKLSNGYIVFRERDYLKMMKNDEKSGKENYSVKIGSSVETSAGEFSIRYSEKKNLSYSNNKKKEYISAENITKEFTLRTWKPGDSFYPLGMKGLKKVSDFLNEQKVESFLKKNQLIF